MGGIFTSLGTSYTGLQANQLMVDVTGNNISNASNEFYSRERVLSAPEKSLLIGGNLVGRGVDIQAVQRIHNDFVFDRYSKAAEAYSFAETEFNHLEEASSFFPDVDDLGIMSDLKEYFNAWKDISKNPSYSAQKQVLAEKAKVFTQHLKDVRSKVVDLQKKASDDLEIRVKEINDIGAHIAKLNKEIKVMEDKEIYKRANTLRDQRDELEFKMRELLGGNVFKDKLASQGRLDRDSADFDEDYLFSIGRGLNIVDGGTFHPIVLQKDNNSAGLNRVYLQGYDFKPIEITDKLVSGKIGALIDLYNDGHNGTKVGKFQNYINMLDTFARSFIEASNAIYAQSATHRIESAPLELEDNVAFGDTNYNLKQGSFDLVVYDADGNEVVKKSVQISDITTMRDVVNQINANTDDNGDHNSKNDVDDFFRAYYNNKSKHFIIEPTKSVNGFSVAIRDHGTNFPGVFGINSFFEGDSAANIELNYAYQKDATTIRTWMAPVTGNFEIANMMQQMQYDDIEFYDNKFDIKKMKLSEFYEFIATKLATDTQSAQTTMNTKKALLESAKKEHLSISQVSVDEEMVNLIKFQSGYSANAKVITAIDKMIDTLLSIKQ
ncbi:flagellar hook-associated protein [Helicobacter mustelae]|uniref:flagellar hook-associated protein FlgK n=1 Tax=Helicobacter mustelae TaxID=217 RepID=UPI000DFE33E6|nr:flagellar hook-associated protein FlgK [Helicobacter mustelae]STP12346.1 flagellar hook-associated protein [Helicobacter mustelae]